MSQPDAAFQSLAQQIENHGSDEDEAHLAVIENHTRTLTLLLTSIVAHSDLKDVPQDILRRLSELGVITDDDAHVAHIRALRNAVSDLREPTNPQRFFNMYYAIILNIANHDLLATELINVILLWRNGLAQQATVIDAIEKYREDAGAYLLKGK